MPTLTPDDVLLGLLAAQPQHGYQLLESFRDPGALGSVWRLSTSQLYAVLKRLERGGWIVGDERHSPDAPPRIEYTLTSRGRDRLEDWLSNPQPVADIAIVRVEFLCRLYIARLLNVPTANIVRAQRRAIQLEIGRCLDARQRAAAGIDWLSREFDLEQLRGALHWIERCELVHEDDLDTGLEAN